MGIFIIRRKEELNVWEILSNVNILLTIITSCLAIGGAIIGIIRFTKRHSQSQSVQVQAKSSASTNVTVQKRRINILYGLDFWDKAEIIGSSAFGGIIDGFVWFIITLGVVFLLSVAIFAFSDFVHPTTMSRAAFLQTLWIDAIISAIAGLIIGSMVGTVSGVNKAKKDAEYKRSRMPSSITENVEPNLPNAPLFKPTGNPAIDRVYNAFYQQVESNSKQPWGGLLGALIVFAESDQYGDIVNLMDHQSWLHSQKRGYELFSTKYHTYIRSYPVYNNGIYAAVFKDLHSNGLYVLWSDKKRPALVVVSSNEIIAVDWR
jgi:hypothetical protein